MLFTVLSLAVILLIIVVAISYILLKVKNSYWLKFLLIPVLCVLGLFSVYTIPNLLGYAYPGYPSGRFTYVDHWLNGKKIDLLVKNKDGLMRLYVFPYSNPVESALNDAHKKTIQGASVMGKFQNRGLPPFPISAHTIPEIKMTKVTKFHALPPKQVQQ